MARLLDRQEVADRSILVSPRSGKNTFCGLETEIVRPAASTSTLAVSAIGGNDTAMTHRAVILVEGVSDQRAVEAVAELRGRDLAAEGVAVVPIGGAQAIGRYLGR